ncbi:SOS response-associated peptidase [Butyrivibrio sp. MC2013]|uniref:SOS response-associated peptidase n=1 Tax=Butyrivibrio sp. MC2013 TaxID=1280686 RepID=UPI0004283F10|nr:SOS response-associated peptidase family protein [Butyrivibrio sp. MC2013]
MCGRFTYREKTSYEIEKELMLPRAFIRAAKGDICPGMDALSFIKGSSKDDLALEWMFWGIKNADQKLIINARAETITQKASFSQSMEHRRCILPAAAFYEWNRDKTKYTFTEINDKPIYLAGFYDLSDNRDSFVIITTAANSSMLPVHDRMPVMIDKKNVREYLYDHSSALDMIREPMPELKRSCEYEQLSLF